MKDMMSSISYFFTLMLSAVFMVGCGQENIGKIDGDSSVQRTYSPPLVHDYKSPEEHREHREEVVYDTVLIDTYAELHKVLDSLGFDLDSLRSSASAPDVRVLNISASIKELSVSEKKRVFISEILAAALIINEEIADNREKLIAILKKDTSSYTAYDKELLKHVMEEVRLKPGQESEILLRYDVLPNSLIIAQAILESAWGTSYFAIQGNSLFGEHISPKAKGAYIQARGSEIRLRAFESIEDAVRGYIHNINRNKAYKGLWVERKKYRDAGKPIDPIALANTEDHYSEIGHEYTIKVIGVINYNKLEALDNCRIGDHMHQTIIKVKS